LNHTSGEQENHISAPLTAQENSKEALYAQIMSIRSQHTQDVCRLIHTVNVLNEKLKKCASDSAVWNAMAYQRGFIDGHCGALNTAGSILRNQCSQLSVPLGLQEAGVQQSLSSTLEALPHNPSECFGCTSEEGTIFNFT
uniref:IKBKB_SDD domain-containing protein n=1 Tax=Gongylonema pulchrum TaxID=637853 RepID=A0A183ERT4_9BILA